MTALITEIRDAGRDQVAGLRGAVRPPTDRKAFRSSRRGYYGRVDGRDLGHDKIRFFWQAP